MTIHSLKYFQGSLIYQSMQFYPKTFNYHIYVVFVLLGGFFFITVFGKPPFCTVKSDATCLLCFIGLKKRFVFCTCGNYIETQENNFFIDAERNYFTNSVAPWPVSKRIFNSDPSVLFISWHVRLEQGSSNYKSI